MRRWPAIRLNRNNPGDSGVRHAIFVDWNLPGNPPVEFLPCIGGFVGADMLVGIVAVRLHESSGLMALMDLGTNGEVVVGNRERMLCTSTAAGPAFEGARISMGMRAATGAISEVRVQDGSPVFCRVIGVGEPRGLCGSGLVDAVAVGLELKTIQPNGRMVPDGAMPRAGSVSLLPADVRELQLAKGAIATGLRMLTARLARHWMTSNSSIWRVRLEITSDVPAHSASDCCVSRLN